MTTENAHKEKVFSLTTISSFDKAERFKLKLENKGYKVTTETYGINAVIIRGDLV